MILGHLLGSWNPARTATAKEQLKERSNSPFELGSGPKISRLNVKALLSARATMIVYSNHAILAILIRRCITGNRCGLSDIAQSLFRPL